MPLKIRCPHCRKVLVAEDEVAGQMKACPACNRTFTVPLPLEAQTASERTPLPQCPHCAAEISPTASHCHACLRDLTTGRKLPLMQRIGHYSWRFWLIGGTGTALLLLSTIVGIQVYRLRQQMPRPFSPVTTAPTIDYRAAARELLTASDPSTRSDAAARLRRGGVAGRRAIRDALAARDGAAPTSPDEAGNLLAAFGLLSSGRDVGEAERAAAINLLLSYESVADVGAKSLEVRALLGDEDALAPLAAMWMRSVRRELLLDAIGVTAHLEQTAGARAAMEVIRDEALHAEVGLRALAERDPVRVYTHLAEGYWDTWSWPGQALGERYADALFDLARPSDASLRFDPSLVRQPRDMMKLVAENGSPAARAAAGIVVSRRGPQYRSLSRQIATTLGHMLGECTPRDQQRLVWTLSRLLGRSFANTSPEHPRDVTRAQVIAALAWAGGNAADAHAASAYPGPPNVTRAALGGTGMLVHELLDGLRGDWEAAETAADRWLASGLGMTDALRSALDPGQRTPNHAALAHAMIIVAELGDESSRRALELWRSATDQPAWVPALAYCTLGSLDARRGVWLSGWPKGLDLGDVSTLRYGKPGWSDFGRVIAAGGSAAIERLRAYHPPPLPADELDRLVEAARANMQRDFNAPGADDTGRTP